MRGQSKGDARAPPEPLRTRPTLRRPFSCAAFLGTSPCVRRSGSATARSWTRCARRCGGAVRRGWGRAYSRLLGDDHYGKVSLSPLGSGQLDIVLGASVLHLRGASMGVQPVVSAHGILLWNGEVFGGIDVGPTQSDTLAVAASVSQLEEAEAQEDAGVPFSRLLAARVLSAIQGPFALLYYRKRDQSIIFCRDRFGRRSLLRGLFRSPPSLLHRP